MRPAIAIQAVKPSAAMNSTMPCSAVVVAASSTQTTNAAHITKPNQAALSISAAAIATSARAIAMPRCGRKYLRSCSQDISVA